MNSTSSDTKWRRVVALLLPYLVLVSVHVVSGLSMEQPVILADEVGYLGNARYLAGAAPLPNMRPSQFYHFGYSLFLLPAFWLFDDPGSSYRAALVINALLASAVFFPLRYVLRAVLDLPEGTAGWVAVACGLYPSLVLYSNFAWSENAFVPAYAATVALFGAFLVSRRTRDALLFGALAGLLYTIHPRALPVLAIVAGYLLLLAIAKVLPRAGALLAAASMGAVFLLTRLVNEHLKALAWSGRGEYDPTQLAGRLLPGTDFPALVERALGQVLYLTQASHGLFLVGLAAVLWRILSEVKAASPARAAARPATGVPIFVLLTASGILMASCTANLYSIHGPEGLRGANLIHGRYDEAFAVLVLGFGLAAYTRRRLSVKSLAFAAVGVAAVLFLLTFVVAAEVEDAHRRHDPSVPEEILARGVPPSRVDAVNVPGVFPLVGVARGLKLYPMSLLVLGSFLALTFAIRFTTRGGLALLALLFGAFAVYNHNHFVVPTNATVAPRVAFASQLERLGPIEDVSYDAAHQEPEVFFGVQYLMPRTVFHWFDSREREIPSSEAVISGNKWRQARRLEATFAISSGWDNALWLLPGELSSRLPAVSYEGETLGTAPKLGIQEAGFHLPERFLGAPGRWTTGRAALKVPLRPERLPETLAIETLAPGREGAELRVLANRVELWRGPVPPALWSRTFSLERVPMGDELLIELESDTSPGGRRLGVVVRGVRLTARADPNAPPYEGVTLGAEPVLGFEESGFHAPERIDGAPARWTTGRATLTVPVTAERPPRRLAIETLAPGRDGARLRVLANGVELWDGRVPAAPWSGTFLLERVPMEGSLRIELETDTFSPADAHPESPDTRRLGVAVRAIRLKARDREPQNR